ncbi:sedoheptulokinase-like [Ischnura elegans]|uniref:sedoheptulokinase-like n=1 Tax=Ischnura elegans TaxID=197161 RepID=UPI001ED8A88E|nr:sedoheptulokinase-like [Ischnura elegans]
MADEKYILGIDIGTTSVKGCIVSQSSRQVVSRQVKDSRAGGVPSELGVEGNKQDAPTILSALYNCLSRLPKDQLRNVSQIGICGQMHGVMLWDGEAIASVGPKHAENVASGALTDQRLEVPSGSVSHVYTWQDSRCSPEFLRSLPKPRSSHLRVASGFGCATLFWKQRYQPEKLQNSPFTQAGTVQDFIVALLCGLSHPVMSVQNAASWGYFDTEAMSWETDLLAEDGFPVHLLPPTVVASGSVAGHLVNSWYGIPAGTPVGAALGDLPCSVLATLVGETDAVMNVSTSAQLAFVMPEGYRPVPFMATEDTGSPGTGPSLETVEYFPYFDGRYLSVAASMNGGNVLAAYVAALQRWVGELSGGKHGVPQAKVWECILKLGEAEEGKTSSMKIQPLLFGERHCPERRASIEGIGPSSLGLGPITKALCVGLVDNIHRMMPQEKLLASGVKRLLGVGSALARNKILQSCVRERYELRSSSEGEEGAGEQLEVVFTSAGDAAFGAALAMLPKLA